MRNRFSFRAALIGALSAASACTAPQQAASTSDQQPVSIAATSFSPRASSANTVKAEHYEVPPDFDADVSLHPYTSGLGPCPHGGPGKLVCGETVPPSHYNH